MKALLVSAAAGCLALCMAVSVQAGYMYTKLDVPGASSTYGYGIEGSNIVGWYVAHGGGIHGFLATIPEPATLSLLTLGGLMLLRR